MAAESTLVIPAYNRGSLIAHTLDSALAQTRKFHEIIVVDDGSTDNTPQVLARYEGLVTFIATPNQGVQKARNLGIERARTEFVTLLDSDDLLMPEYLDTVLPWLEKNYEQDVVYSNFCTFSPQQLDNDKLASCPFDFLAGAQREGDFAFDIPDLYQRSLKFQPLFQCGLLLRRAYVERHGAYNPLFNGVGSEDWEFTLRAISRGRVAVCSQVLAHVRRHEGNDSANSVHMNLGEAQVLEFSLANHGPVAKALESAIRRSAHERRLRAFDTAYARGDFALTDKIQALLGPAPLPAKTRLKQRIAQLPNPLRQWLWRCTQFSR